MGIIKVVTAAIAGVMLAAILKNAKSEMTVMVTCGVSIFILFYITAGLSAIIEELQILQTYVNISGKYIFYSDNVQFTGISGFAHNYEFLLQRSKNKPERLCRVMNNPTKNSMGNILFAWSDTRPARRNDSQLVVLLNDKNSIANGIEEAFYNYDAKVVKWSERETASNIDILTA